MTTAPRKTTKKKVTRRSQLASPALDALALRLHRHALKVWGEDCQAISIEAKGRFFYIGATTREPPPQVKRKMTQRQIDMGPSSFKLCRIENLGSSDRWGFAFYKYSDETYEPCMFPSGSFEGTPEEAFDCAAKVYLVDF